MRREQTEAPFVPFKLVIETEEERGVLEKLEIFASSKITGQIAAGIGLTYDEADNVLENFGKLLRQ